ncbi:MAG: twin-arginine translocase subunit TatC [Sediminibacterium sp.]|jgi:sec-independent protein translocase protein TatC|nr:twin-arginine translocase subunit TatC [Sediminibacterium sp.]
MAIFDRFKSDEHSEMSFIDHLEVLRGTIVRSLFSILIAFVTLFIYRDWIMDHVIMGPLYPDFITYKAFCDLSHYLHLGDSLCMPPVKVTLQSTTFGGQFLSAISMAFIGAIIVAFPFIFWQFWSFVKPALKENELKNTRFMIFFVSFFFFVGAAFGFFILGPFTFNFLAGFQLGTRGAVTTIPTFADYIDNLTNLILGCGIAFEMPVIMFLLTKIGIVTPKFLRSVRKYAVIVILVISAFITPSPDWYSQTIVFIPLYSLFEFSIIVSAWAYRSVQKADEEWD